MKNKYLAIALLAFSTGLLAQKKAYSLNFKDSEYVRKTLNYNGRDITVRAYENIIYVSAPVDTAFQKINIYIPEDYYNGKSINGYSAANAPIFLPNQIGGYMPAKPGNTTQKNMGEMPPLNGQPAKEIIKELEKNAPPEGLMRSTSMSMVKNNTIMEALLHGYVVASPGARGRTSAAGKAPSAIIDLKAAVRYLKYNDGQMPGDAKKIISNGTSAGGAMSSLLGATGNNLDYEPYLKKLGAAPGTDDIFAVSAYCPITNLDHADAAYEWQFNGQNSYAGGFPGRSSSAAAKSLTQEQISTSNDLKALFPEYVNSLKLTDENGKVLTLEKDGSGPFKDLVKSFVLSSANKAIDDGTDISGVKWITFKDGHAANIDWDSYITDIKRQKAPPAFDALDLSSPENQEFGTDKKDKSHFTDYSKQHSSLNDSEIADKKIITMMNPMNYIGDPRTKTARYWRIRHGSRDRDGSLATPILLATLLKNKGMSVDISLPWDKPHSGDYDLENLFEWIDTIVLAK